MKTQIISSTSYTHWNKVEEVVISSVRTARSLDEFDINFVDLTTADIWRHKGTETNGIDEIEDIQSLCEMIRRKKTASVVIVLPPNLNFNFAYNVSKGAFIRSKQIKDCLGLLWDIVSEFAPLGYRIQGYYENTKTTINGKQYPASFCFDDDFSYEIKSRSDTSNKITTIEVVKGLFFSTIQIFESEESVLSFVNMLTLSGEIDKVPAWAESIEVLNDQELKQDIENARQEISRQEEIIANKTQGLSENTKIKSVLYETGDKLVEVVFFILEKILDYDLSGFVDENKEDFLIRKDNYTLIGEIKGISTNVKNNNINQIDTHYQDYTEQLEKEERDEDVYPILVINPFKDKDIALREQVNEKQIHLAKRNGCLIIETKTLLKLYEEFYAGRISMQECERLFTSHEGGLLRIEDFVKT